MTEQEDQETGPEARNRLERETQGSADNAWMSSRAGLVGALLLTTTAVVAVLYRGDLLTAVRTAVVTSLLCWVNWIRHRRFAARARWLRETPNWWERLDEAPTLLTFPRTVRAVRRLVERGKSRRYPYE
jgi:hypothetical protein